MCYLAGSSSIKKNSHTQTADQNLTYLQESLEYQKLNAFSFTLGITAAESHYRLQCCLISAANVTTTLWGYKM